MEYDLALIATSCAFGVGGYRHRHPWWPLIVYAAAASVLFRATRLVRDARAMALYWHDLAAAILALAVTLCSHPSACVRRRVAAGALLMAAAHRVPASLSRPAHALGHLAVVAAAWTAY